MKSWQKKSLQLKAEGFDLIKVHLLSISPLWLCLHQEELKKQALLEMEK
ncbi:hypothetical protein [Komarekiella delphini-convector]|nr:hypothetical protein [Komarekiella delphini-convector]